MSKLSTTRLGPRFDILEWIAAAMIPCLLVRRAALERWCLRLIAAGEVVVSVEGRVAGGCLVVW